MAGLMKDRRGKDVKSRKSTIRRRNPVAKALIQRAMGTRPLPTRRRYTRKVKHPRPVAEE